MLKNKEQLKEQVKCACLSEELEREVVALFLAGRACSVKIADCLELHCELVQLLQEVKVLEVHMCLTFCFRRKSRLIPKDFDIYLQMLCWKWSTKREREKSQK